MLTTALLLALATAPATPAFFKDVTPRAIRLVDDDVPRSYSYSGWSREQLRLEYDRLDGIRPGIGLPIGLLAGGGGALLVGLYALLIGASGSGIFGGGVIGFYVFFGIIGTVGTGMLIFGGILLSRILPERREVGRQMDEVERLINSSEAPPQYGPPQQYGPPPPPQDEYGPPVVPPPPPLPPAAMPPPQVLMPAYPITLARF